ncbi:DUF1523 family protein [Halomonas sp. 11-S5]|uniref:DUF1523 family protein n=1 Tax=Halomonas sp. 11-S5 TaxID=2994064 RepID=UPI00246840BE|nr:DUF1523 family protein [Halomonas sp. 11-S5]
MKRLRYTLFGVMMVVIGAALHYALPQVDVVRLIGTDVKRVDTQEGTQDTVNDGSVRTTDVYFILAESKDGDPRNYRNEDALVYGKFDSSDLHTRARSIAQNEQSLAAVRHYGWRVPIFSMFPNAVHVWKVDDPGYRHFPLFNIIVLSLLAGGATYIAWRVRGFRQRLSARRVAIEEERAEQESLAEQDRSARRSDDEGRRVRDEFLSGNGSGKGRNDGSSHDDGRSAK